MNPRTRERNFFRGIVDLIDGALNTLDHVEKGKPLPQAIREGFRQTAQRPARSARPAEVPYCEAHNVPLPFCVTCRARGEG
jgi:hypothetical protein